MILASLILFPELEKPDTGVMILTLPPSLRGLMVATAAAYMSTKISDAAQLGRELSGERFFIAALKFGESCVTICTAPRPAVFLTLVSAVVTFYLDSIAGAWKLLLVTGAGTGGVLLLRWYWWRINAWSEVSGHADGVRCLGGSATRVGAR